MPRRGQLIDTLELVYVPVMARVFIAIAKQQKLRDLSFVQMTTIMKVFLDGPQTISGVAQSAAIAHSEASRLVERLVKMGLVDRTEDKDDRRAKRVQLTKQGLSFPPFLRRTTREAFRQVLQSLPPDAAEQLAAALDVIQRQLPQHPAPHRRRKSGAAKPMKDKRG